MPLQEDKLTQTFAGSQVRAHVPSNDTSASDYKPVYEDTKKRMESVFGKRKTQHWPNTPATCSKCYSLTPAIEE